jgi:hypothetical protein
MSHSRANWTKAEIPRIASAIEAKRALLSHQNSFTIGGKMDSVHIMITRERGFNMVFSWMVVRDSAQVVDETVHYYMAIPLCPEILLLALSSPLQNILSQ